MVVYHGSKKRIVKPLYGQGKPYNDYGRGFYCTQDIEMAKEWGCSESQDGYANIYEIDMEGLKVLNLSEKKFTVLHWIAVLLKNRSFRLTNPIAKDAKEYLIKYFYVDTAAYDVIVGYRADDSYFSFAEDFLNNAISVEKLAAAMRLGNLGEQVVFMSPKAFGRLQFVDAQIAQRSKYYAMKIQRDQQARSEYLNSGRKPSYGANELYMLDILRQEVQPDDPRLR